ncbi:MAG: hypothetical protein ACO1NM_11745 [Sphingobium phenoxybenzoativorans]
MKLRPLFACLTIGLLAGKASADTAPFDLVGPSLQVSVTRAGATLPISQVPDLSAGDQLTIKADFTKDQSAHYLLVAAFLRGATNPPPKDWVFGAETWKRKAKDNMLKITVPGGARQIVLFLAPETGGDFDALVNAVRGRPGEFVRASQDLNQASLDRSRLDAFLNGIRLQDSERPAQLETVSPLLARSLAIKFNAECLEKPANLQAACLTQDREALVLSDMHSTSLTEALTGAPTDLALQLAATPQGGMGYYSPYIGAVRDLAKILGAFRTADYQYIPALALSRNDGMALLLNAAPSFRKPQSVLVTALPAIEAPHVPPLRAAMGERIACLTRPDMVLPVEGAPLIYSTLYARSMAFRVKTKDGKTVDIPVTARADKGGFTIDSGALNPLDFDQTVDGVLHGLWGFRPFEGPSFRLQNPGGQSWRAASGNPALTAGRAATLRVEGAGSACVERVAIRQSSGKEQAIVWKATDASSIAVEVPPLADAGTATLLIKQFGVSAPSTITLQSNAPQRPGVTLLSKSIQSGGANDAISISLAGTDGIPGDAALSFSIKANATTKFTAKDRIEVATADGSASVMLDGGKGLRLENTQIAHARLDPAKDLGPSAFGLLRFRLVRDDSAGDWQPLGKLIRLPSLKSLVCQGADGGCALSGSGLFLIASLSDDAQFTHATQVAEGFTGSSIEAPRPKDGRLYLKLRDDPDMPVTATIPGQPGNAATPGN